VDISRIVDTKRRTKEDEILLLLIKILKTKIQQSNISTTTTITNT